MGHSIVFNPGSPFFMEPKVSRGLARSQDLRLSCHQRLGTQSEPDPVTFPNFVWIYYVPRMLHAQPTSYSYI